MAGVGSGGVFGRRRRRRLSNQFTKKRPAAAHPTPSSVLMGDQDTLGGRVYIRPIGRRGR